jgi:hypothetical protein
MNIESSPYPVRDSDKKIMAQTLMMLRKDTETLEENLSNFNIVMTDPLGIETLPN